MEPHDIRTLERITLKVLDRNGTVNIIAAEKLWREEFPRDKVKTRPTNVDWENAFKSLGLSEQTEKSYASWVFAAEDFSRPRLLKELRRQTELDIYETLRELHTIFPSYRDDQLFTFWLGRLSEKGVDIHDFDSSVSFKTN
jgi:hypothetical protein